MRNLWIITLIFATACSSGNKNKEEIFDPFAVDPNPAGPEFNIQDSDSAAIAVADQVMEAMGGRMKWEHTRYFYWDFFGKRQLTWDKLGNKVRIDSPGDSTVYFVNTIDKTGKVYKNSKEIADPEELGRLLQKGYEMWINDSYWLVMPFKLKDSGVTLNYAREDTTMKGATSHVLQLTFENVGVTPQNKYEVWVDKSDSLIKQWAFYKEATQDSASAIWPWDNYKDFNGIKISTDRSDKSGPRNVEVPESVSEEIFQNPEMKVSF